jgi:putative DNA primase/helicase
VGFYDTSKSRGRGAWIDEGRIVYHFGNVLTVDGAETHLTKINSKYAYEQGRHLLMPSVEPLSDDAGRALFELAQQFRWVNPASAILLAGWSALAPICGALPWRSMCG